MGCGGSKPEVDKSEGRKVGFDDKDVVQKDDAKPAAKEAASHEYVKSEDVKLSEDLSKALKELFDKMDIDKDGSVTKDEAIKFWGKNFAKVNATAMFNEVDEDGNGSVDWAEFMSFWKNVVGSGYPEDDLVEEVGMILEGGSWVDFNDGRTT